MEAKNLLTSGLLTQKSSANGKRGVKLLEQISTKGQATPVQGTVLPHQKTTEEKKAENLQSIILNKLAQLEQTVGAPARREADQAEGKVLGPQHVLQSVTDLMAKIELIFNATDKDDKQKLEELNRLYQDEVHEELKAAHKTEVHLRMQGEFVHFKNSSFYDEQQRRAQLVLNKYEVLTREYQTQNRNLKDNHERIISAEQSKRQEIINNFETHLTQIKQQIRDDTEKFSQEGGGEVAKENTMLKTQYDALVKEIDEKSKLMDEQINQKEQSSGNIEEEMTKKIQTQEEEIRKQITLYQEQTLIKQDEENELSKVLVDYKKKHDEFAKAMKKSRETFKVYEGEIKNMNQRIQELTQLKKKLLGVKETSGNKKKQAAAAQNMPDPAEKEAQIEKIQAEWIAEKEALAKEKEELMQSCKELQEKIKEIKEGK